VFFADSPPAIAAFVPHVNAPTRLTVARSAPGAALRTRLRASSVLLPVPLDRLLDEFHETSEARLASRHSRMRIEVRSQKDHAVEYVERWDARKPLVRTPG